MYFLRSTLLSLNRLAPIKLGLPMNVKRRNLFLGDIYLSVFSNDSRSGEAVLYFHGFPGPTLDNSVVSLAELLAEHIGVSRTLYAPRYSGLAESNGKFSFLSSIYDGLSLLYHILSMRYSKVSIVGYSWGAVVALNCFRHIPVRVRGMLVLLAPVTHLPKNAAAESTAQGLIKSVPWSLRHQTVENLVLDWEVINAEHNPYAAAEKISPDQIYVIQGSQDDVVPQSSTDAFVASLGEGARYTIFDEGHSFVDKLALMDAIKNALSA
jgi:esterase/lipase